jgi:hypothetical protein
MANTQNTSSRSANPFTRSCSFSSTYPHPSHPQIPRLQLHDRVASTRAESLGSPLRSNMSYAGNILEFGGGVSLGGLNGGYYSQHGLESPMSQPHFENCSIAYDGFGQQSKISFP